MKEHPKTYRFRRIYANLPINLRSTEIACVVDCEPMTFNVIKLELDNKTEFGYKAVDMLDKMGFLK